MARHFIDHAMDYAALLLNKETGEICGKVLAYFSNNPNGSVCHARVFLYYEAKKVIPNMPEPLADNVEGIAGGYGYDKLSAAVSASLNKLGLGCMHDEMNIAVFGNGTGAAESQAMKAEAMEKIKASGKIPVYSGAGNVEEAFSLYFRVIRVL